MSLIDGLAHGSDDGDPDYICQPVAGTLARVPWSKTPLGQCLISMYERDGRPYFADARHVLAGVLARFTAMGLTPVVAVEYEFYLLEDISGEVPRPRTGRVPGSTRRPAGPRAYSLEDLHDLDAFFREGSRRRRPAGRAGGRDGVRVRCRPVRGQPAS